MLQELTDETFDETVDASTGLTLVEVGAAWCPPCKMYGPVLEQFQNETDTPVYKVDVDNAPETAKRFAITAIPTTLVYFNGEQVDRFSGVKSRAMLKNMLADYLTEEEDVD